jgi:hypothetical protein
MKHKIVAVTPAGRRHYLELLRHYVCADATIDEWHLWDNCWNPKDRRYIEELEAAEKKVKLIRLDRVDGTSRSVNQFYQFCTEEDAFYIKIDDDIVYLPEGFGGALYRRAMDEHEKYLWWSPLIINNSICSWLIKHHSLIKITEGMSCQASDLCGWLDPAFAEKMHRKFLAALKVGDITPFFVPDFEISLSRFSINCVGFFGADVKALGPVFCPPDVDDEEWISAYLPSRLHRPGRVIGNLVVAHFSFTPQEPELLQSRILDQYYKAADLAPVSYALKKRPLRQRAFFGLIKLRRKLFAFSLSPKGVKSYGESKP